MNDCNDGTIVRSPTLTALRVDARLNPAMYCAALHHVHHHHDLTGRGMLRVLR